MTDQQDIIRNIETSEAGPQVAAIFDFDGTIISGYSATAMLKAQLRRGDITPYNLVDILGTTAKMATGSIGFSGMMTASAQLIAGASEDSYRELGEEIFEREIHGKIYPEARAIIEAHRARGHTLAIISSATPYQVEPAARELGIENVLCTRFEVENGEFTGNIIRPVCFGKGKVFAAQELAGEHGIDLARSYFYSDSDDDIELLEHVGKPQAMNPNKKLTKIAERRGWQVRRLREPVPLREQKKPGLLTRVRSLAATGSLIGSFVGGLPILWLTGSKCEAVNFSVSTFGDVATALIGLKLNVRNEKHLWSARPCVFIFNHQSGADLVLIAKLLKRDIASIGKKELAKVPLIGQVIQYAGAVLIDRENTQSAIEAMTPLVNKMREEQVSVCLAPEGTRSNSKSLGHFKKGAFHLAMQAGVPIVPIVIHNSYDALPGEGKVFCPATIEVDVLEPVDTSDWKKQDLDQHVAEMERKYLEVLGYDSIGGEPADGKKKPPRKRSTNNGTNNSANKRTTRAAGSGANTGANKTSAAQRKPAKTTATARKTGKVKARRSASGAAEPDVTAH